MCFASRFDYRSLLVVLIFRQCGWSVGASAKVSLHLARALVLQCPAARQFKARHMAARAVQYAQD
eukprot:705728-Amphidinium_carterae.1